MNNPKFRLGTLTNYGQVCGFFYSFYEQQWAYTLVSDFTATPVETVYKGEDELKLIEGPRQPIPQSVFSVGDEVSGKVVTGIYYHQTTSSFAYRLSKSDNHSRYLNWIPEKVLVGG